LPALVGYVTTTFYFCQVLMALFYTLKEFVQNHLCFISFPN
jgi:hypothetical protein